MSRTLLILLALPLLMLFPDGARAACGAPPAATVYETPEVEVYMLRSRFMACSLPAGTPLTVGFRHTENPDEYFYVTRVIARRYLHVLRVIDRPSGDTFMEDQLTDLRTGAKITALRLDAERGNDVAVVAGALVSAGAEGVVVQHTDGRTQVLDTAPASGLATSGGRFYWHTDAGPQTAFVWLQASSSERDPRRAYTVGRCVPSPGAELVLNDDGEIVVTRRGFALHACRKGRTRRLGRVGRVRDVESVAGRAVAYTRAGRVGVLDLPTGRRRELHGEGSAYANVLVAADSTGVRVWPAGRMKPMVVAEGPASDAAVAPGEGIVYWRDSTGQVKSRGIRSVARPTMMPASTSAIPSA